MGRGKLHMGKPAGRPWKEAWPARVVLVVAWAAEGGGRACTIPGRGPSATQCSFSALPLHSGAAPPLSHVLEIKCIHAPCTLRVKAARPPNCETAPRVECARSGE